MCGRFAKGRVARAPSPATTTTKVELLVFVIMGLGAGHYFLNVEGPVTDRADPCCAEIGEGSPLLKAEARP